MMFSNLEISLSHEPIFGFNVPYFEALYFENYGELDVAPLSKVGVYM